MVLSLMRFTPLNMQLSHETASLPYGSGELISRLSEWPGSGVETAEHTDYLLLARAEVLPLVAQRGRIGRFFGAKAAVAAARVGRADRAAARMRDGAEAGDVLCNHHAHRPAQLA